MKDLILPLVEALPEQDSNVLSMRTTTRIQQIVYELSENRLCPHTFRHNRLNQLAMEGATVDKLKQWKGAADIASITPYLLMSPIVLVQDSTEEDERELNTHLLEQWFGSLLPSDHVGRDTTS